MYPIAKRVKFQATWTIVICRKYFETKWNFHDDVYVRWWRKRIAYNVSIITRKKEGSQWRNIRCTIVAGRIVVADDPLYLSWIKGCPLSSGWQASRPTAFRLWRGGARGGEKKEKREKNYNEYFNKPRPIYFERDYAPRFVVCFGATVFLNEWPRLSPLSPSSPLPMKLLHINYRWKWNGRENTCTRHCVVIISNIVIKPQILLLSWKENNVNITKFVIFLFLQF